MLLTAYNRCSVLQTQAAADYISAVTLITCSARNIAMHQLCEKALLCSAGGTRTCIHTPGASYAPEDLDPGTTDRILSNAQLVYFDGRLTESAVVLARAARKRGIPVLVEAERLRPTLEVLLQQADYVCTSAHFPQVAPLPPPIFSMTADPGQSHYLHLDCNLAVCQRRAVWQDDSTPCVHCAQSHGLPYA